MPVGISHKPVLSISLIRLAQDLRGNLAGTVLGSSGAVVPSIEVKAM